MPQTQTLDECFLLEKNRLASFKSWPFTDKQKCSIKKVSSEVSVLPRVQRLRLSFQMAEAGFYWKGNEVDVDSAACFLCGKVLDGWEPNDDPWSEHRKHAPQCAFVKLGRPERQITVRLAENQSAGAVVKRFMFQVAEFIDLMDVYTVKLKDDTAKKAADFTSEKMAEINEHVQSIYRT